MIKLIVLDEVLRHVVDVMVRFDSSDRLGRHHCGRIRRDRRLGLNRCRDHAGRQERHRREIQLSRCRGILGGCRAMVPCHRLCHFRRARRYITGRSPGRTSPYRSAGYQRGGPAADHSRPAAVFRSAIMTPISLFLAISYSAIWIPQSGLSRGFPFR